MWKKYGFACDCIVAYSIPFNVDLEVLRSLLDVMVSIAWKRQIFY